MDTLTATLGSQATNWLALSTLNYYSLFNKHKQTHTVQDMPVLQT